MQQHISLISDTQKKVQDLYFSFCGFSINLPNHSVGPSIRSEYIIHIVLEGEGHYMVKNRKIKLSANQGFLIEPGYPVFYQSSAEKPWKYLWIGFNGKLAADFLYDMGIFDDRLTFQVKESLPFFSLIKECFKYQSHEVVDELMLNSLLYKFLALIVQNMAIILSNDVEVVHPIIPKALDYLRKNFKKQLTIQQISSDLFINRSYLSRLFREQMTITIKEYLNHLRIIYASDLLSMTTLTVGEISDQSGFSHVNIFIRAFKKQMKTTPLEYRKGEIRHNLELRERHELYEFVENSPIQE